MTSNKINDDDEDMMRLKAMTMGRMTKTSNQEAETHIQRISEAEFHRLAMGVESTRVLVHELNALEQSLTAERQQRELAEAVTRKMEEERNDFIINRNHWYDQAIALRLQLDAAREALTTIAKDDNVMHERCNYACQYEWCGCEQSIAREALAALSEPQQTAEVEGQG